MTDPINCGCGKGHASMYDHMCRYCREKTYRRSQAKSVGVRHRGDGMTLEQSDKLNPNRIIDQIKQGRFKCRR